MMYEMEHDEYENGDVFHGDEDHGDEGHGDVFHGDEDHGDEDHGDVFHGDEGHGDEGYGDEGHGDEDHGDEDHGDEDHGDEDHGDNDDDVRVSYDTNDFISKPVKSETCTIDENVLRHHYSFGYDCSKMFNLCAADDRTIVYAAGSYINVFDVENGSLRFRKCAGNGGIGHIAKHPVFSHLAVGENCDNPPIIVYEWPTFKIVSVLNGSAKKKYNWLTYSKNGQYLCSQAGDPDNTLTVWDWKESVIILTTKSHTQDVRVCSLSSFIPGHLVTAGSGHIKFWKMAQTFTGLKLQGQLGLFGKTDISDVIGVFSMPDEKVISSCDWGNILVWDEQLVNVEVMRKERKPCHLSPIIMFLYSESTAELTTVSMDGTIKFWYYPTIETADPPEDDRVLEMEPTFTINVRDSVGAAKITGMCKLDTLDPSSYDYFIQDGNGGLWLADIEVVAHAKPLKRLAKFHGDRITSLQASPVGYFIATASLDGWLHVHDVVNKKLIFLHDFGVPITSLIWLPLKIASSGNIFAIGFQTGILKTVAVSFPSVISSRSTCLAADIIGDENSCIDELQISKPHTSSIGHLTLNRGANVLVCGSDDRSIFLYKIETGPFKLKPIGMYPLPGKVTFVHWKPSEKRTALISCDSGHIVEVKVPASRPLYTKNSFLLKLESRTIKTTSVKSELLRNDIVREAERKKTEKINRKREQLETLRREENNAGVEIDEQLYYQDSEDEAELPALFVPEIPNPVLFAVYTPSEKSLWVSVDGYDAGYLYEYDFHSSRPIRSTAIPDKNNNIPLTAIKILGSADETITILMGFADGKIRVVNAKTEDMSDFSDFIEYSVHDNTNGKIKMLCFSEDNCMLYTCGDDRNIFSFMYQCDVIEKSIDSISELPQSPRLIDKDFIETKEDPKLSLEEIKINKERHKQMYLADKEKERVICLLYNLKEKFKKVLDNNKALPKPLQFDQDYFRFHERIDNSLITEAQAEMDKLHAKLEFEYEKSLLGLKKVKNYFVEPVYTDKFEVRAILQNIGVETIYHRDHHNLFTNLMVEFMSKKHTKRSPRKLTQFLNSKTNQNRNVGESEIFLRTMLEKYKFLPKKIQSAIDKYRARITYENDKIFHIERFENKNKKTDNNIEDIEEIEYAWETIGDFSLKTSPNFKPSEDQLVSMEKKFQQYMNVKEEINSLKSNFNEKIVDLRKRKIMLLHDYKQFKFDVYIIQNELNDPEATKTPPNFPKVTIDESIEPSEIDSFEPVYNSELMDLILNFKSVFQISKNQPGKDHSLLETTMQQIMKDKLKYRHKCLHESMLMKITKFDNHINMAEKLRMDIQLKITFLKLFSLTLEEELIILNNFDLLEDNISYILNLKTEEKTAKVDQIIKIQNDITSNNTFIGKQLNALRDVQQNFNMAIRNNNFAKHLRKIFNKKLKILKVKIDDDEDSSSSTSSDDSDDSGSESENNKSDESLTAMGQLVVYHESVLPEGCDPALFALTFEMRSKRYEIEENIKSEKMTMEASNKKLVIAYAELDTIENELKANLAELEEYQTNKRLKLNDIETTIVLNTSQMSNAKLLRISVLVNGNVMQDLKYRVTEIKKETDQIETMYKKEQLKAKWSRTEITKTKLELKNYKVAIKDEIMKKFKTVANWSFIDDMERTIISYMIINSNSSAADITERFTKEIKLLKKQISDYQEIMTELLGAQTTKRITLKGVRECNRQIQQLLITQQKNITKYENLSAIDDSNSSDLAYLKDICNTLSNRKESICKEITSLKQKGKMFPPIC